MSYEVHKITSRQDLEDAVNFIHSNNFSLKTFEEKISTYGSEFFAQNL